HRLLDVGHREVEDGEAGGAVALLGVDEHLVAARELEGQHAVRLGEFEAQDLAVEVLGPADVVDREAAEGFVVLEHGSRLLPQPGVGWGATPGASARNHGRRSSSSKPMPDGSTSPRPKALCATSSSSACRE